MNILSTIMNGTYASGDGTSFAAPFVTGVAALLLSKYPNLTPQEVAETLYSQAEDLGDAGWYEYYRWGLVNAYAAVTQPSIPEFSNMLSSILLLALSRTTLYFLKKKSTKSHKYCKCQVLRKS